MPNFRQKYLTESYYKAYRVLNFKVFFEEKEGHFNNHANAEIMFDLFSLDYTAGFDLNILDGYVFKIIDFLNKAYNDDIETAKKDREYTGRILTRYALLEGDIGVISLILMFYPEHIDLLRKYIYPYEPQDPLIDTMINLDNESFVLEENKFQRGFSFRKSLYQALISDKKEDILKYLKKYLTQWYDAHRKLKYRVDGHLEEDIQYANYIGYWSFEAAFVAYYKGVDDSELHDFIYYPKDLVVWLKKNKKVISKKVIHADARYTDVVLEENKKAEHEGYYEDHFTKKVIFLNIGDIAPVFPAKPSGKTREYVWRLLSRSGVSDSDSTVLDKAKHQS